MKDTIEDSAEDVRNLKWLYTAQNPIKSINEGAKQVPPIELSSLEKV